MLENIKKPGKYVTSNFSASRLEYEKVTCLLDKLKESTYKNLHTYQSTDFCIRESNSNFVCIITCHGSQYCLLLVY